MGWEPRRNEGTGSLWGPVQAPGCPCADNLVGLMWVGEAASIPSPHKLLSCVV